MLLSICPYREIFCRLDIQQQLLQQLRRLQQSIQLEKKRRKNKRLLGFDHNILIKLLISKCFHACSNTFLLSSRSFCSVVVTLYFRRVFSIDSHLVNMHSAIDQSSTSPKSFLHLAVFMDLFCF